MNTAAGEWQPGLWIQDELDSIEQHYSLSVAIAAAVLIRSATDPSDRDPHGIAAAMSASGLPAANVQKIARLLTPMQNVSDAGDEQDAYASEDLATFVVDLSMCALFFGAEDWARESLLAGE